MEKVWLPICVEVIGLFDLFIENYLCDKVILKLQGLSVD